MKNLRDIAEKMAEVAKPNINAPNFIALQKALTPNLPKTERIYFGKRINLEININFNNEVKDESGIQPPNK